MKRTLLEITQEILNEMDADNVNSIDDTIESQQVAEIVRSCYNEMISNRNWPHLRNLIQFEASGTVSKPSHMKLPANVRELSEVKYDVRKTSSGKKEFRTISYMEPQEFLSYIASRDSLASDVQVVNDFSGVQLLIYNDLAPSYYTSFDDEYLVFDSFNSSIESTLQQSKTQGLAYIEPEWSHEDGAYPDLPPDAFSKLIEEAKSTAFLTLKQMANEKAEQRAARQGRWLALKSWRVDGSLKTPNYGRK